MAKSKLNCINISGLADLSGVTRGRLSMAVSKGTGKVLDSTERKKAIKAMEDALNTLKEVFSDADSL